MWFLWKIVIGGLRLKIGHLVVDTLRFCSETDTSAATRYGEWIGRRSSRCRGCAVCDWTATDCAQSPHLRWPYLRISRSCEYKDPPLCTLSFSLFYFSLFSEAAPVLKLHIAASGSTQLLCLLVSSLVVFNYEQHVHQFWNTWPST